MDNVYTTEECTRCREEKEIHMRGMIMPHVYLCEKCFDEWLKELATIKKKQLDAKFKKLESELKVNDMIMGIKRVDIDEDKDLLIKKK